jgi:voltage-gated potassium channel
MPEARERGEQEVPRRVTWDVVMAALALLSLIPVMWVELAGLHFADPRFQVLAALDLGLVLLFGADWMIELRRAPDRRAYAREHWYELLGMVPLYLEGVAFLRVAQVLRLARVLRALRAFTALRRVRSLHMLDVLINRHKMLHTALVAAVVVVTLAAVVWKLERDSNPDFAHFGDALWWAIVTTTTVGYGDITPQTGMARLVATGLMLMGIGLIAVLASSCSAALIATDPESQPDTSLPTQLERLAALHERGHLSAEEFAEAKRRVLGS